MFELSDSNDERECIQIDPKATHPSCRTTSSRRVRFSAASPNCASGMLAPCAKAPGRWLLIAPPLTVLCAEPAGIVSTVVSVPRVAQPVAAPVADVVQRCRIMDALLPPAYTTARSSPLRRHG